MRKIEVQITDEFLGACRVVANEPSPGSTVQERAREVVAYARPGQWLEPWRVEIVVCLMQRLGWDPDPNGSQRALQSAWDACPQREGGAQ